MTMNVHCAIVRIVREDGFVSALGHRVALHLGGEPELKRRVLAKLAQLDVPPDEIRFERPPVLDGQEPEAEAATAAPEDPGQAQPAPAEPPPRKGRKR